MLNGSNIMVSEKVVAKIGKKNIENWQITMTFRLKLVF